jgi:thiamine biosynthesis lipoprotein
MDKNRGLNNSLFCRYGALSLFVFIFIIHLHSQEKRFEFEAIKMGTSFHLIIYGEDSLAVKRAAELAWLRIDEINNIFSDYSTTSEVSSIHKYARDKFYPVSKEFARVLEISLVYSRLSCGAFDVTIGGLTRMWRRSVKMSQFPEMVQIKAAREGGGYKKLKFKNTSVKIPPGLFLDFGAIAKGYAVDEAYRVLADNNFPISLVDGGGDIYCGPPPPGKPGWSIIGLTRGEDKNIKDTLITVYDKSVVTSGDAYKFIEHAGLRYSHIINPKTGLGIPGPHWTTVVGGRAIHADALATTLSVLPVRRHGQFIKKWAKNFSMESPDWRYSIYFPQ